MKLQDSDIISAARDLRDEQNEQLNVAPSPFERSKVLPPHGGAGRGSFPTPLWWGAVAAALVVGFFVGKGIGSPTSDPSRDGGEMLRAAIERSETSLPSREGQEGGSSVIHDTIYETRIVRVPVPTSQLQTAQAEPAPSPGCSMLCDEIRYDLLAGN